MSTISQGHYSEEFLDNLDAPLLELAPTLRKRIIKPNTLYNGYDSTIEEIEYNLKELVTRIKRRYIHVINYREKQIRNNIVPTGGIYNKYLSEEFNELRISAKNFLKLIRWCRYFTRTYPAVKPRLIIHPDSYAVPRPTHEMVIASYESNRQFPPCYICKSEQNPTQNDEGINYCQVCLYRREKFLNGQLLCCVRCDVELHCDNFEWWEGKNWCQKCLWNTCFESGLVYYA